MHFNKVYNKKWMNWKRSNNAHSNWNLAVRFYPKTVNNFKILFRLHKLLFWWTVNSHETFQLMYRQNKHHKHFHHQKHHQNPKYWEKYVHVGTCRFHAWNSDTKCNVVLVLLDHVYSRHWYPQLISWSILDRHSIDTRSTL